jgi:hypothetical protein
MSKHRFRILAVAGVAAAALAVLGISLAGGAKAPRWPISALSHSHSRAHSAASAPAVLAGDSDVRLAATSGPDTLYVSHEKGTTLDCVYDHISAQAGGGNCVLAGVAESRGAISTYQAEGQTTRVLALVPDGVSSVTVTSLDGATTLAPVTNNVAVAEVEAPASVTYELPNRSRQTRDVRAQTAPLSTLKPSPPGSSE